LWDAESQLPEYVKQALQYESYTKIHGTRALQSKLVRSLSRAAIAVDTARMQLLTKEEVEEKGLKRVLELEGMENNRNWELMKVKVNGKCVMGLGLDGEVGEGWVKGWAGVLLSLAKWVRGEEIELPSLGDDVSCGRDD
jgi:N-terminal acetyltransferase B complex non-catalytic subunit